MKKHHRSFLGILFVIACALAGVSIWYAGSSYLAWSKRPLGPALETVTIPPAGTFVPQQLPATWTFTPSTPLSTITLAPTQDFSTSTPLSSGLPPCYGLPPMTILAIGADARSDEYQFGRADAIRLVRVDYMTRRISVLEFPRDLWVYIPEIQDDLRRDHDKLNTAYYYGNPGLHYWDHPSAGPGLLARTLEENFDAKIDHYVAVSMDVFVDLVDALGGIDITLARAIDGRTGTDRSARLYFPAGEQHLNGEQALTLGRIRNVSVFTRAEHQNLVMCAVRRKLESPEALTQMPEIISAFQQHIQTDLTPAQISQLACLGTNMPAGNILFASFPRELFVPGEAEGPGITGKPFIWNADFSALSYYVDEFSAGRWPSPSGSSGGEEEADSCE
jgi:LCP family protein required for cell wall assembly